MLLPQPEGPTRATISPGSKLYKPDMDYKAGYSLSFVTPAP